MNEEQEQYYKETQMAAELQAQAQLNAQQDSGLLDFQNQQIENSRQFYLGYEDMVDDLEHLWVGDYKKEKVWYNDKRDDLKMMSPKAAMILRSILEGVLNRVTRLSNFQLEQVYRLTFAGRDAIESWLMTQGQFVYNIDSDYYEIISYQCEMLILSSLQWALNAGGRNFMTTSGRTVENVTQLVGEGVGRGRQQNTLGMGYGQQEKKKWWKF